MEHLQNSQVCSFTKSEILGAVGSRGSEGVFPGKLLNLAFLKVLEKHQFLKRWTFRPSTL